MKKTLLLITIILAFTACKKDKKVNPTVFGTWELRHIGGGWGIDEHYSAGNGNKYVFKADSTYIKYKDNQIESSGRYSISVSPNQSDYDYGTIKFPDINYTDAFQFKPGTIIIGTSIADGPTYEYTRIR
ncbi:hypothetical protein [Mucilaginibacter segetis]|uniref:Lipocalin-like domain-containing protein n=1 Tax=Mucilaginibacter segetis TaxID=2793071 RepID=A0A934PNQ4_9SPHI|nr:hypothetical protein [Mucilaginibacter segetis]MBK0377928.1 hypothetical protein [Mucilaginibacter segetis]